jgi:hypothetical protein
VARIGAGSGNGVLKSVLKRVVSRQRGDPSAVPGEDGRYYSYDHTVRWLRENAEQLSRSPYLGYPYLVHLETLATCNAACTFCPYPTLDRQGTRMPDALIEKIIGDLTAVPRAVQFTLAPYKVSEPFLDVRLPDILDLARAKLPNALVYLSSNVAALTEKKMDDLARHTNIAILTLSINSDDPEEYEAVMKIPFDRTLARLTALHERAAARRYPFPIRITRVTAGRDADRSFMDWARAHFPAFQAMIFPRNDWIGTAVTPGAHDVVPDAPCHRWFDLSIMATGEVALCCMDGKGEYPKGDVRTQHVLEIYNQPRLVELRKTLISRRQAGDPCNRCTYISW